MPSRRPARARIALARWYGAGAAVLTALLLAWLTGPLFVEPLFDRYQRWSPRHIGTTRVLVVRIDAESLRALGPWPWPRSYLALLTDRLREGGAAAVGFDLMFTEQDASNPQRFADVFPALSAAARAEIARLEPLDETFANAVGQIPTVVARAGLAPNASESADGKVAALAVEARFIPGLPRGVMHFDRAIGNVEALEFTARGQGLINGEPDRDGVTRRQLMVADVAGQPTPGFALDLTRLALDRATIEPQVSAGRLRGIGVGNHGFPVATDGRARLHYGTMPEGSEVSAVNVIRKPRRADAYAGRIVLVGPASIGLGDVRSTPLGTTEFGVRIHAQAVDAILQHGWLDRPGWAIVAEWLLAGALALLAIAWLPKLRGLTALVVPFLVGGVVLLVSWEAFALGKLLLDPVRPLIIGGAAALAIAAAMFFETGRMSRSLRDSALAQSGEMKAAREIQRAMLPDRNALSRLSPRLDLDALLEPAQMIGGDLYDAFALPDGRIVFLVGDVTGKGASAALFMAVSKALAHSLIGTGKGSLETIVSALNDELAIDSVVEVTMLCGIIDLSTGDIDMVNAGHENPWIVHADGRVAEIIMDGGLPLCTMPGYAYPLEHTRLNPGDGLMLITDGVREAQDDNGNFFGSERTRGVLTGWTADVSAQEVTTRLVAAVREFEDETPPSDDLTVMALRYRGA